MERGRRESEAGFEKKKNKSIWRQGEIKLDVVSVRLSRRDDVSREF